MAGSYKHTNGYSNFIKFRDSVDHVRNYQLFKDFYIHLILILLPNLHLVLPSDLVSDFLSKIICELQIWYMHATCPTHLLHNFILPNNNWWTVKIMKRLIMQSFPPVLPPRSIHIPCFISLHMIRSENLHPPPPTTMMEGFGCLWFFLPYFEVVCSIHNLWPCKTVVTKGPT
jgi:hypothetical protein